MTCCPTTRFACNCRLLSSLIWQWQSPNGNFGNEVVLSNNDGLKHKNKQFSFYQHLYHALHGLVHFILNFIVSYWVAFYTRIISLKQKLDINSVTKKLKRSILKIVYFKPNKYYVKTYIFIYIKTTLNIKKKFIII